MLKLTMEKAFNKIDESRDHSEAFTELVSLEN